MSEKSNSELESYSNEIARLVKLLDTREASARFLIDSAKESERRARADEKMAEAKEYAWRDKCDRLKILLRECLPLVDRSIDNSRIILSSMTNAEIILEWKIKRSKLEALRENIEKELDYAENLADSPRDGRGNGSGNRGGKRSSPRRKRSRKGDNRRSRNSEA